MIYIEDIFFIRHDKIRLAGINRIKPDADKFDTMYGILQETLPIPTKVFISCSEPKKLSEYVLTIETVYGIQVENSYISKILEIEYDLNNGINPSILGDKCVIQPYIETTDIKLDTLRKILSSGGMVTFMFDFMIKSNYHKMLATSSDPETERPFITLITDYATGDIIRHWWRREELPFDINIYTTPDHRVCDKIYYSFIQPNITQNLKQDPTYYSFCQLLYQPQPIILKKESDPDFQHILQLNDVLLLHENINDIIKSLEKNHTPHTYERSEHVLPPKYYIEHKNKFTHICNLPILGVFNIQYQR